MCQNDYIRYYQIFYGYDFRHYFYKERTQTLKYTIVNLKKYLNHSFLFLQYCFLFGIQISNILNTSALLHYNIY